MRDMATMLTLYKSLVCSLLEYCCPLWNPWKVADIQLLEGVQQTITKKSWGAKDMNYWDRLKALKLMSLQSRRERYMILHMWKILHGVCPNDLDIQFNSSSRHGVKATVPSLSKTSLQRHKPNMMLHLQSRGHVSGTLSLAAFLSSQIFSTLKRSYPNFCRQFQICLLLQDTLLLIVTRS